MATSSRLDPAAASASAVTRRLICSSEEAIEDSSDSSDGSGRCGAILPSSPIPGHDWEIGHERADTLHPC